MMSPNLDGTFEIRNLHLLAPDRLQYEEMDGAARLQSSEPKPGKFRPWSSVRTDGTVVMKEGNLPTARPTLQFARCGR